LVVFCEENTVPKAAFGHENCSESLPWRKLTNNSEGKPEQKTNAAFRKSC
jgi:hypothetical protein